MPIVNVVNDEEMSSQGSVNAPVAPPQSPTRQEPTRQVLTGLPIWSSIVQGALTQVSGVGDQSGTSKIMGTNVPVQSTQVIAMPTIVVDAPSRAKTK